MDQKASPSPQSVQEVPTFRMNRSPVPDPSLVDSTVLQQPKRVSIRHRQMPSTAAAMTLVNTRKMTDGQPDMNLRIPDWSDDTNLDHKHFEEFDKFPSVHQINLSFSQKVAIASGHILNDLCACLWFSYLLLYLQKVIAFDKGSGTSNDSRYAAGLMFLGQIVDGIATPLIGFGADRSNFTLLSGRNYGRYKAWHLIGVILVMMSFPFVFAPCIWCTSDSSDWTKVIYYSPFIVVFQIGWASTQISHLALIPKMHPNQLVRTELLAMRNGFTVGANIVVFLMTWFSLGNNNDCKITPNDSGHFMTISLIAVGIGGFFAVLFHVTVKEESDNKIKQTVTISRRLSQLENEEEDTVLPNYYSFDYKANRKCRKSKSISDAVISDEEIVHPLLLNLDENKSAEVPRPKIKVSGLTTTDSEQSDVSKFSITHISLGKDRMLMKDWFTMPEFYMVALVYIATRLALNLGQVYVPLYLQDSLELHCRTIATVPLVMFISGLVVSLFVKILNKRLGRQLAYIFGAALSVSGSILILLLNWNGSDSSFLKEYGIYGVAVLLGGGGAALLVTILSITADLIGNNVENGAFVYGAMSFCDKFSCGIAVLLISDLVPCSDEENNVAGSLDSCNRADNIPFYRNLVALSTGGCAAFGVLGVILLTVIIYLRMRNK